MTRQADRRTLRLQLIPISVSDMPPVGVGTTALATWGALADTASDSLPGLCVCPDEVGELLVRLEHQGDYPLYYRLHVNGTMPRAWFSCHTEGNELVRDRTVEAVVRFRPPADFFENHLVLQPNQVLSMDYHGEVQVYGSSDPDQPERLLAASPFRLFLRPRSLYPQFLPAIYREVDFIGRLLKIFEETFEPTVNTLQSLWAYLDPLTAPEALLPFLAHWVGWQNEATWTLEQQRTLIRRALEIYRWRGTRRGLALYLHLYTGLPLPNPQEPLHTQQIQIYAASRRGFVLGATELGGPSAVLGAGQPFHFGVTLRPYPHQTVDEALVRSIIDQEKPTVASYDLHIVPIQNQDAAALEELAHV